MKVIAAIGIILLLLSVPAAYWCTQQDQKQIKQSELYKASCRDEADDFASTIAKMRDPAQFEKFRRDNPQAIERVREQQKNRLLADIDDIVSGTLSAPSNAGILYGTNWIEEVNQYRSQKQYRDLINMSALVGGAVGGVFTAAALFTVLVKLMVKLFSLPGLLMSKLRAKRAVVTVAMPGQEKFTYVRNEAEDKAQKWELEKLQSKLDELVAMVKAASEPADMDEFASRVASEVSGVIKQVQNGVEAMPSTMTNIYDQGQKALKEQIGAVAKTVEDFAVQFNAIRDYAAYQQQRLAKLEDGYDWNIIKHFCMRVIRCIDNLDSRIAETGNHGGDENLRQMRDELAFVLESSGVEAFSAQLGSEYKGQESRIEVVDEKEYTDDPAVAGTIAQVVKPGYQCVLSSDRVKIVRPAQVRLYVLESKCEVCTN